MRPISIRVDRFYPPRDSSELIRLDRVLCRIPHRRPVVAQAPPRSTVASVRLCPRSTRRIRMDSLPRRSELRTTRSMLRALGVLSLFTSKSTLSLLSLTVNEWHSSPGFICRRTRRRRTSTETRALSGHSRTLKRLIGVAYAAATTQPYTTTAQMRAERTPHC